MGHTCPASTAGCVAPQYGQEGMSLMRPFAPCRAPPTGDRGSHGDPVRPYAYRLCWGVLDAAERHGITRVAPRPWSNAAPS